MKAYMCDIYDIFSRVFYRTKDLPTKFRRSQHFLNILWGSGCFNRLIASVKELQQFKNFLRGVK